MIALPTADETLLQSEGQQESLLSEQLLEFANEAFVFADVSRTGDAAKAEQNPKRFPCPSPAYFADVQPPPLTQVHLRNTRVVPSREHLLSQLPKGGVCVEIGAQTGCCSRQILSLLDPAKLHLCDRDFNSFEDSFFVTAISQGIVELHEGEAAEHLAAQPDRHFDLICIHPEHSYTATARALEQAGRKLKDDGCIICGNYTTYSPLEGIKSGVVRAVNEFCHTGGYEIIFLGLHPLGHLDAALRQRAGSAGAARGSVSSLDAPDSNTYLPDVWEYLIEKYQIRSVLDVGAGAGWSTKWFVDSGVYTLGVEGRKEALDKSQCRANIIQHDYRSGPFVPSMILDLAWCAGFVENLETEFIPNFMASFSACKYACLTHAEPGQPGQSHANAQPTEYWVKKMNEFGFAHDAEETARLRSTDKHKAPHGRKTLTFFKRRN